MSVRAWGPAEALAVTGRPLRIHPMVVGYEPIREDISIIGGDDHVFLLEPVTATAVVYADGWVLLDSGFNVDVIRDPEERRYYFNYDSYTALVPPGDPLPEQVAALGLEWSRLRGCAISHVHVDHTGGLRFVPADVPVVFQRAEYEFGATISPTMGGDYAAVPKDYLRDGLDIVLIEGDVELSPGLTAIDTAGHTPGHQSFVVELASRTVVLACDAADLRKNIVEAIPCGTQMRPEDAAAAQTAVDRLRELDERPGVEVWPGHDPEWWGWKERVVE
ncbi:glyoxylase-like metal-dependent hydrolase (beta-lactamase superfamily II) [Conyzicola lurida]|uniref:Glyoxylase-like metal-dependent hydrolase (Beta-lactamase superfamily II) n=1 Tax=Conyzicola lurida TaxID=1172621 RepID=A0A841ADF9_9MICO|nr:glyoxylase-like metal-dependent hydrolase (beta-lactamase superfamily II) [Conyzicola lurida]